MLKKLLIAVPAIVVVLGVIGFLFAGKALKTTHVGPYDTLPKTGQIPCLHRGARVQAGGRSYFLVH